MKFRISCVLLAVVVMLSACQRSKDININDQLSFVHNTSNEASFVLTSIPSKFQYAGADNPTAMTYTVSGTPNGCSIEAYSNDGSILSNSALSGTTYADSDTGSFVNVICDETSADATAHNIAVSTVFKIGSNKYNGAISGVLTIDNDNNNDRPTDNTYIAALDIASIGDGKGFALLGLPTNFVTAGSSSPTAVTYSYSGMDGCEFTYVNSVGGLNTGSASGVAFVAPLYYGVTNLTTYVNNCPGPRSGSISMVYTVDGFRYDAIQAFQVS